MKEVSRLCS